MCFTRNHIKAEQEKCNQKQKFRTNGFRRNFNSKRIIHLDSNGVKLCVIRYGVLDISVEKIIFIRKQRHRCQTLCGALYACQIRRVRRLLMKISKKFFI